MQPKAPQKGAFGACARQNFPATPDRLLLENFGFKKEFFIFASRLGIFYSIRPLSHGIKCGLRRQYFFLFKKPTIMIIIIPPKTLLAIIVLLWLLSSFG